MKYSGRALYKELGFVRWENFDRNVEKAIQLIKSGIYKGTIENNCILVSIGCGAKRKIKDYIIDDEALNLIKQLSYNKTFAKTAIRNEIVILDMLKKYCKAKDIEFESQYKLHNYRFDAAINAKVLLEFDEQHHNRGKQRKIDADKDVLATELKYQILRVGIQDDIIDIILKLEKMI